MRLTISGSDSSFFLPTIKSTSLSIKTPAFALPELNTKLLSTTHLPKCVLSTRYPIDSFKVKAIIDDGFVAEAMEVSFYELLGIPKSGTLLEIKHAYKQLARKYHPDVSPPDRVEEYTRRFIRVHEAYETLSDPRRRALYDRDMTKGLHLVFSARKCYEKDEVTILFYLCSCVLAYFWYIMFGFSIWVVD